MSQRQHDKHQTDKASKVEKAPIVWEVPADTQFRRFAAPKDHNWALRKQHPSSTGGNKNRPAGPKPTWKKTEIEKLVDEKAVKVLEQTEEGRRLLSAFLKENPNGLVEELGL